MPPLIWTCAVPVSSCGTLKQNLETSRSEYPKHVEEIMRSLYADDIIAGEDTVDQVHELKGTAIWVFIKGQVSSCISGTLMYQNWKQIIS